MSDNQSDNSMSWAADVLVKDLSGKFGPPATTLPLPVDPLEEAEAKVRKAEQEVFRCEEALEEAQRTLKLAKGRVFIAKEKPTWRQIFCPGVFLCQEDVYKYCMQTGYDYAIWNHKLYKMGPPGDQLIDTGATEDDIK